MITVIGDDSDEGGKDDYSDRWSGIWCRWRPLSLGSRRHPVPTGTLHGRCFLRVAQVFKQSTNYPLDVQFFQSDRRVRAPQRPWPCPSQHNQQWLELSGCDRLERLSAIEHSRQDGRQLAGALKHPVVTAKNMTIHSSNGVDFRPLRQSWWLLGSDVWGTASPS